VIFAHLVVIDGIERGAPFDPRIDWVRGNDIELIFGGADEMAAVIIDYLGARIFEHSMVFQLKHRGDVIGNQVLDVADGDVFDFRVGDERTSRYPAPQATTKIDSGFFTARAET